MTETLIEKLEAEKVDYESTMMDSDRAYNQAIDDCIAVVRQHEAAQPQDVVGRVAMTFAAQKYKKTPRARSAYQDVGLYVAQNWRHFENEAKEIITAMGGVEAKEPDITGIPHSSATGPKADNLAPSTTHTLNGKLPTHRNYAEWTAEEFEAVMMQLYPNALPYLKPTPDNPCGHQLRSHDVCKRCGMLGSAEYFIKNELLRGGEK